MKNSKQNSTIMLAFVIISVLCNGCNKNDDTASNSNNNLLACQINHTGTLRVDNALTDPYDAYIDNAFKGTVSGYSVKSFDGVSSGTHSTKYVQHSGYIFTPTIYTLSVNITDCYTSDALIH